MALIRSRIVQLSLKQEKSHLEFCSLVAMLLMMGDKSLFSSALYAALFMFYDILYGKGSNVCMQMYCNSLFGSSWNLMIIFVRCHFFWSVSLD